MFKKMQNRKGFTLIEMLAVIAIVAILVAVIIPIVNGSTDKAAAATNASNLRGVEGEVVTAMLLNPEMFGDQAAESNKIQGNIDKVQQDSDNATTLKNAADSALSIMELAAKAFGTTVNYTTLTKENLDSLNTELTNTNTERNKHTGCKTYSIPFVGTYTDHSRQCNTLGLKATYIGTQISYINANEAYKSYIATNDQKINDYKEQQTSLYYFTADNGYITLPDGTSLEAPVSKKVNTETVTIDEDVNMVVYVDAGTYEARAYYPSGNTELSAMDFAAVAK